LNPENCPLALRNNFGSGIRKKPIPDPGVKKATDFGSGSATLILATKILEVMADMEREVIIRASKKFCSRIKPVVKAN